MNTEKIMSDEKYLVLSKKKMKYLEKISIEIDKGENCSGPFSNTNDLFRHLGI